MKRLLLLLLAVAGVALNPPPAIAQNDPAAVPRIAVAELKTLHAAGSVTVVDVRDAASFQAGHIPGALSIPLEQVAANVDRLKSAKKPIVAYCA